MKILAIDPSINNVGLACYDTEDGNLITRVYHPKKGPIQLIARQIVRFIKLDFLHSVFHPSILVVEYPSFFNSAKGHIAAKMGYTLDLAYIAGCISSSFDLATKDIYLPTPFEWKGNLPKEAIGHRFEKRFRMKASSVTDHEFEAAMMIDWLLKC